MNVGIAGAMAEEQPKSKPAAPTISKAHHLDGPIYTEAYIRQLAEVGGEVNVGKLARQYLRVAAIAMKYRERCRTSVRDVLAYEAGFEDGKQERKK